ncbi:MAG: hypothetical protein M1275_00090 [Patescibacteria group bacterium]|nr:hypothetical protein [Patescibacteria group bacterium]
MTNKFAQLFVLFVVILVLVGFSVVLTNRQVPLEDGSDVGAPSSDSNAPQTAVLVVEKTYAADANTFRGSLMVDEPCSMLGTDVDFNQNDPEQITLVFSTSGNAKECGVATAKKDFIVVVPSSESAKLEKVVFNGTAVSFEVHSQ